MSIYESNCHAMKVTLGDAVAYHATVARIIAQNVAMKLILEQAEKPVPVSAGSAQDGMRLHEQSVRAIAAEVVRLMPGKMLFGGPN